MSKTVDDDEGVASPTLSVPDDVDEEAFFTTKSGDQTFTTHEDAEQTVPDEKKPYLTELERYWTNKPYSFILIYKNERSNNKEYFAVEPHLPPEEADLLNVLKKKLRQTIDPNEVSQSDSESDRSTVIRSEMLVLLRRYNLYDGTLTGETTSRIQKVTDTVSGAVLRRTSGGLSTDITSLTDTQVKKLIYFAVRDFVRFGKIDPIKHDVNIEDISCDGYNSKVFVDHTIHGSMPSNIRYGERDLDRFVTRLAQEAGEGITKREPQVDCTLADGSRAQLTLGTEASDKGTNFTIRQFNEIPYTPLDLIAWQTYDFDRMAYLWLLIEHGRSMIVAGGTASGKTTTMNACSLFIPSTSKIVSIEDTRELEIPQANWVASVTRDSATGDEEQTIDEYDLLEAALRQRPEYIIMGEVRGEEGRDLLQAMNTGHVTYTTFHADSDREVILRFTNEPIDAAPPMFGALDLITIQKTAVVDGTRVRRNSDIVEMTGYDTSDGGFATYKTFRWNRSDDEFRDRGKSAHLEAVMEDRGWSDKELERELLRRKLVFAYMMDQDMRTYEEVSAVIQAYMANKDAVMRLIANGNLRERCDQLRRNPNVDIDADSEAEELTPRPNAPEDVQAIVEEILTNSQPLLAEHRGDNIAKSLLDEAMSSAEAEAYTPEQQTEKALEAIADEDEGEGGAKAGAAEETDPAEIAEAQRMTEQDSPDPYEPSEDNATDLPAPVEDGDEDDNLTGGADDPTTADATGAGSIDVTHVPADSQPDSVRDILSDAERYGVSDVVEDVDLDAIEDAVDTGETKEVGGKSEKTNSPAEREQFKEAYLAGDFSRERTVGLIGEEAVRELEAEMDAVDLPDDAKLRGDGDNGGSDRERGDSEKETDSKQVADVASNASEMVDIEEASIDTESGDASGADAGGDAATGRTDDSSDDSTADTSATDATTTHDSSTDGPDDGTQRASGDVAGEVTEDGDHREGSVSFAEDGAPAPDESGMADRDGDDAAPEDGDMDGADSQDGAEVIDAMDVLPKEEIGQIDIDNGNGANEQPSRTTNEQVSGDTNEANETGEDSDEDDPFDFDLDLPDNATPDSSDTSGDGVPVSSPDDASHKVTEAEGEGSADTAGTSGETNDDDASVDAESDNEGGNFDDEDPGDGTDKETIADGTAPEGGDDDEQ